jgi:hypothetical protein
MRLTANVIAAVSVAEVGMTVRANESLRNNDSRMTSEYIPSIVASLKNVTRTMPSSSDNA